MFVFFVLLHCFCSGQKSITMIILEAKKMSSLLQRELFFWHNGFGYKEKLGGGFKHFFYFYPYLGKWSNLTNIFQMGWNHHLEKWDKCLAAQRRQDWKGSTLIWEAPFGMRSEMFSAMAGGPKVCVEMEALTNVVCLRWFFADSTRVNHGKSPLSDQLGDVFYF